MCGIAGFVGRGSREQLDDMTDLLAHRGPDGRGVFYETAANDRPAVGLGHRRLSIIDLSDGGRQPMNSNDGRFWISFNGEIYNFKDLRSQLEDEGVRFRSQSDTEVLLQGYALWGSRVLERLNGIFAFAVWDCRDRVLFLARDHLGVKPLYYAWAAGSFVFASEIKALLRWRDLPRRVDPAALDRYLSFLWVPDPGTIFRDVHMLPAGHYATLQKDSLQIREWWDCSSIVPVTDRTAADHVSEVRSRLEAAVTGQMVSDVPLGAFLSGGVDSSAVVALMRTKQARPSTYTVGFTREDLSYEIVDDDMVFARDVAQRLGTDSHEIVLQPDVLKTLPKTIWHMDEPVADPAAISAYLICQEARKTLTVMLNGQGADEMFGGYPRHRAVRYAEYYNLLPASLRNGMLLPALRRLRASGPGRLTTVVRNLKKLTRSAELPFRERYLGYLTHFHAAERLALYTPELREELAGADANDQHYRHLARVEGRDPLFQMCYLDLKTFLPSLNLCYTDKMSMAHSVEVRVPFLDPGLVEAAMRVPSDLKIRRRRSKHVLKEAVADLLPGSVISRRKAGFTAPIRGWLQRDLHGVVEDWLSPAAIRNRGFFSPEAVQALLAEHRAGREDQAWKIWQLLTFELWAQTFLDRDGAAPLSL